MTLNYGLVTDAPVCTLGDIDSKQKWEPEVIRSVISEVAECVLFWHCKARAVHGNIVRTRVRLLLIEYKTDDPNIWTRADPYKDRPV